MTAGTHDEAAAQDAPPPPERLQAQLSAFADRLFCTGGSDPGDDAIALPVERLEIYRTLTKGGYRTMLRFALTNTLRLVDHVAGGKLEPGGTEEAIARLLESNPAATHSTREIADRFVAFFEQTYPALYDARPGLAGLIRIELAELRARYAQDDPGRGLLPTEIEELAQSSVEGFLALELIQAPSASLLRLDHPSGTLYQEISERRFPEPVTLAPQIVSVSRFPESLLPVVLIHAEPAARVLEGPEPGAAITAEGLAERWLGDVPPALADADDAARFQIFGSAVLAGLRCGFLRLA